MSRIYPMEDTSLYPPRRYRSNSDYESVNESVNEESSTFQNTENNVNNVNNVNIGRSRISATSGDTTNVRQSQNQNSNRNNNSIQTEIRHYYIRRNNNTRSNHRGRSYSIQTIPPDRRNNTRRHNERLLNERSSNSINRNSNNRMSSINRNNITNENQKCIICQSDDDDLILSKICICWSSYVCYPCMENMATRNIINCPICRRKLKYNLKSKTGTNIKNISYILLPYVFNLVGLIIVPIWFFESFFFQKENTKLQQDYKNINRNDVLTLLCTPTLFLLIILFNKIIMYPFNIILFKTTALYYNYPREMILPLDFRCNFSKLYMYALLSYESLYIIICCLIDEYRISALRQYFVFNTMLYTVPFLVMALCFILIGIHNTIVRIQNKIEKYIEYNVQSVHMNTSIEREQQVLERRMEII